MAEAHQNAELLEVDPAFAFTSFFTHQGQELELAGIKVIKWLPFAVRS